MWIFILRRISNYKICFDSGQTQSNAMVACFRASIFWNGGLCGRRQILGRLSLFYSHIVVAWWDFDELRFIIYGIDLKFLATPTFPQSFLHPLFIFLQLWLCLIFVCSGTDWANRHIVAYLHLPHSSAHLLEFDLQFRIVFLLQNISMRAWQ